MKYSGLVHLAHLPRLRGNWLTLKKLVERGSSYVVCEGKLYLVTVKPARAVVDEETKSV